MYRIPHPPLPIIESHSQRYKRSSSSSSSPSPLVATSHFGLRVAFVVSSLENLVAQEAEVVRSKLLSKSLKPLHFGSLKRGSSCCHFKNFFSPPSVKAGDHKQRSIHFLLVRGLSSSLLFSGCFELLLGVFGIREEEEEEEEERRQEEEEE